MSILGAGVWSKDIICGVINGFPRSVRASPFGRMLLFHLFLKRLSGFPLISITNKSSGLGKYTKVAENFSSAGGV